MKKIESNYEEDEDIDLFIKEKLFNSSIHHCKIDPSLHFKERTMNLINKARRRRRIAKDILFASLAIFPFLVQQIWLSVRSDYFSISRMPQGDVISYMYRFFISSGASYILIIVALGLVSYQLFKFNTWSIPILKKVPFFKED